MILSIQYLRAFAAMMVVLFHASDHLSKYIIVPKIHAVGAAGVDVFFVISGLIMWLTTVRDVTSVDFMSRRLIRIAPLYWCVTLAMFAMPFISGTIAGGVASDPTHLLASLLFLPNWNSTDPLYLPIYRPGWTINFEMMFYVIFGLWLFAKPLTVRFGGLMLTLGVLAASGLIFSPTGVAGWYTSPLLLEFAAGALIAVCYESGWRVPQPLALAALITGIAALAFVSPMHVDLYTRALVWGVPAFLIVFGALFLDRHGLVKDIPAMRFLGDASYALYLTHLFANGAIGVIWHKFDLWHITGGGILFMGSAFATSLALAALTHLYIEKPLLRLARVGWQPSLRTA